MEVITEHYKEHEDLLQSQRKQLSINIVRYLIHNSIWVTRADFGVLTKMIVEEFPTEDPLLYYNPPGDGHLNPRGLLYNRYVNQTGEWRKKLNGVYKYRKCFESNDKMKKKAGSGQYFCLYSNRCFQRQNPFFKIHRS